MEDAADQAAPAPTERHQIQMAVEELRRVHIDCPALAAGPAPSGSMTTGGTRTVPTIASNFTRYYENIRDVIQGKAELAVTPQQALAVMRGLELAVTSSKERRVLPWPRD